MGLLLTNICQENDWPKRKQWILPKIPAATCFEHILVEEVKKRTTGKQYAERDSVCCAYIPPGENGLESTGRSPTAHSQNRHKGGRAGLASYFKNQKGATSS